MIVLFGRGKFRLNKYRLVKLLTFCMLAGSVEWKSTETSGH